MAKLGRLESARRPAVCLTGRRHGLANFDRGHRSAASGDLRPVASNGQGRPAAAEPTKAWPSRVRPMSESALRGKTSPLRRGSASGGLVVALEAQLPNAPTASVQPGRLKDAST